MTRHNKSWLRLHVSCYFCTQSCKPKIIQRGVPFYHFSNMCYRKRQILSKILEILGKKHSNKGKLYHFSNMINCFWNTWQQPFHDGCHLFIIESLEYLSTAFHYDCYLTFIIEKNKAWIFGNTNKLFYHSQLYYHKRHFIIYTIIYWSTFYNFIQFFNICCLVVLFVSSVETFLRFFL